MGKPDDKHPQYDAYKPIWTKCRDAARGQNAIHAGGESYLPKLQGQSDTEYKAYKARALYFNATGRTVEAMRGLVFRKDPVVEVPAAMEPWLADITLTGITLNGLSRQMVEETLTVGRAGLLVDYPTAPDTGTPLTISQAQQQSLRPFISPYSAEHILNWRTDRVGAKTMLTQVFLYEAVENDPDITFQVRELTILDGFYQQIVHRQSTNGWFIHQTITPQRNGSTLDFIPFWFVGPEETSGSVSNPPIEDLVYINLSHYMNSADLEHGAHFSGLPLLFAACDGLDPATALNVGSATAVILPSDKAKLAYAQVGSEGFESLEKLMDRKEQQMAAIGARLIAPEKKAAEAAETAGIRRGGENSVLADLAGAVEMPIRQALEFMAEWAGLTGDVTFELNKDFLPMPMDAQMLTSLVGAWQSGALSDQTFFEALQAGEMVNESVTFEDEQVRKEESAPALGMTADANSQ